MKEIPAAAPGSSRTAAPIAPDAAVARVSGRCEEGSRGIRHDACTNYSADSRCCGVRNIWLGWRIARFRQQFKVSVGDGGHEPLLRRMRAQANFIENAPFFLILIGGLELSGANRIALALIAALFMLARIAHAIGMDAAENRRSRMYGMMGTTLATLGLALWAVICAAELWLGR